MSDISFDDVLEYMKSASPDEVNEIQEVIEDMSGFVEREIELEDVEEFLDNAFSNDVERVVEYCKDLGYTSENEEEQIIDPVQLRTLSLASRMELEHLITNFFNTHKFV